MLDEAGNIYPVDNDLTLKKRIVKMKDYTAYIRNPLLPKGHYLFWDPNRQSLYLFRNDFRHPVKFDVRNDGGKLTFTEVYLSDGSMAYSVQVGKNWHLFEVKNNPLYYFRYLILLIAAFVVFMLINFIKKVQRDQLVKKHEDERKVLELQLKSIKNQLHPHFTLNVLNSIGGLYHKDQQKADYYFGKYSKLVRQTLLAADKISVPLGEEIEFIRNYLDLEKFRYAARFDYTIVYGDDIILKVMVPRMLIHIFVENAVKHGLRPLKEGGLLEIVVRGTPENVLVHISDNGIGREKALDPTAHSTGMGLHIAAQIISIYNQLKTARVSFSILDLKDTDGTARGTEVIVAIRGI